MRAQSALLSLIALVAACDDGQAPLTFDVRVLAPDGTDPTTGREFELLRLQIAQEGLETIRAEVPVTDGFFDVSYSFESLSAPTRVRFELSGGGERVIGAPPQFVPVATGGVLRFAVGEPNLCSRLDGFNYDTPLGASATRVDSFVLVAGGESSDQVRSYDLLRLASAELEPLPQAGPVTATRVGETAVLMIMDGQSFVYDLNVNPDREDRVTPIALHEGAGAGTSLLTYGNGSVLAVGPGAGFSIVAPDRRVIIGAMQAEGRIQPSLAMVGDALLIIGGTASGQPLVEVVDRDRGEASVLVEAPAEGTLPPSRIAFVDDSQVWLLHGDSSSILEGCPDCMLREGPAAPAWTFAAPSFLVVDGMLVQVTGPGVLENVAALDGDDARGAFAYESGQVLLTDDAGAQLCFPDMLSSL